MEFTQQEMERLRRNHEQQKKAKRDYYHRNKDVISQQRKLKYESKKIGVAGGGSKVTELAESRVDE